MCSDNKSSHTVSFGLGALLGAGAGFFLSTKKGRKLVKQAWKQIEPYVNDAVDTAKDEFEEVKGKAKIKADELKQKTGEFKSQAEDFKIKAEDEVDRRVSQIKDLADEKLPPSLKKPIKRTFFKGV